MRPRPAGPSLPPAESAPKKGEARPSFFRERSEGIGLSIVKRLCELLAASGELESPPGAGTTFRIVLPRHDDANMPSSWPLGDVLGSPDECQSARGSPMPHSFILFRSVL